jgi:hypothetical protein
MDSPLPPLVALVGLPPLEESNVYRQRVPLPANGHHLSY